MRCPMRTKNVHKTDLSLGDRNLPKRNRSVGGKLSEPDRAQRRVDRPQRVGLRRDLLEVVADFEEAKRVGTSDQSRGSPHSRNRPTLPGTSRTRHQRLVSTVGELIEKDPILLYYR